MAARVPFYYRMTSVSACRETDVPAQPVQPRAVIVFTHQIRIENAGNVAARFMTPLAHSR
jgi:hypothetical protein